MSEVTEDRIVLRQSWLGTLSKCPEQARQIWEGVAVETDSSYTMLGTAVHSGIEQCLSAYIDTGTHLGRDTTIDAATAHWKDHEGDIVRWHHKPEAALDVIQKNIPAVGKMWTEWFGAAAQKKKKRKAAEIRKSRPGGRPPRGEPGGRPGGRPIYPEGYPQGTGTVLRP